MSEVDNLCKVCGIPVGMSFSHVLSPLAKQFPPETGDMLKKIDTKWAENHVYQLDEKNIVYLGKGYSPQYGYSGEFKVRKEPSIQVKELLEDDPEVHYDEKAKTLSIHNINLTVHDCCLHNIDKNWLTKVKKYSFSEQDQYYNYYKFIFSILGVYDEIVEILGEYIYSVDLDDDEVRKICAGIKKEKITTLVSILVGASSTGASKNVKYVSNGTHGCVMNPAVSCSGYYQNERVSKLFKTLAGANDEYSEHKNIVEKLDPRGEFTVVAYEKCNIHNDFFKNVVSECKNFGQNEIYRQMHPQIVYDNGGIDLTQALHQVTFEELFIAMHSIFKGLTLLKSRKYAHLDIKPANIVYNKTTKKMCLIDFGLSQEYHNIVQNKNLYIFEHPYRYYPPEFDVYAEYYKLDPKTFQTKFTKQKLRQSKNFNNFKYYVSWKVDPQEIYDIEIKDMMLNYLDRIDVYMLGVTIAELLKHYHKDKENIKFYGQVIELVKKMTYYAPHLRITPEKAYIEYKKIVNTKIDIPDSVPKSKSIHNTPGPKVCPPGKIINPKTGRCIKEPKPAKVCPPGKIINPKTGRCINAPKPAKVCPPGKIINPKTGRCINAPKPAKVCPPGKIINPKTGRCIKEPNVAKKT
jgi:serine/threonine protein kinase